MSVEQRKWNTFRQFLQNIIEKIDNNSLNIDEIFYLCMFYDGCHHKIDMYANMDEDEKEKMRIIILGIIANNAMKENSSPNNKNVSTYHS